MGQTCCCRFDNHLSSAMFWFHQAASDLLRLRRALLRGFTVRVLIVSLARVHAVFGRLVSFLFLRCPKIWNSGWIVRQISGGDQEIRFTGRGEGKTCSMGRSCGIRGSSWRRSSAFSASTISRLASSWSSLLVHGCRGWASCTYLISPRSLRPASPAGARSFLSSSVLSLGKILNSLALYLLIFLALCLVVQWRLFPLFHQPC